MSRSIAVINAGSSSVKFALYDTEMTERWYLAFPRTCAVRHRHEPIPILRSGCPLAASTAHFRDGRHWIEIGLLRSRHDRQRGVPPVASKTAMNLRRASQARWGLFAQPTPLPV